MLTIYKRICETPPRSRRPFSRPETVVSQVTEAVGEAADVDDTAVWLDLLEPTRDEELALEDRLGLALPTQEDMIEIESSSRLYLDKGAAFMTAQGGLVEKGCRIVPMHAFEVVQPVIFHAEAADVRS